jgi:hypothetical protein
MNTTIAKKILLALLVLILATMITACDLTAPVDTGSSVEVVLGGVDGAGGARSFGTEATWVSINVVLASSGVQKGSGVLTKTAGVWRGTIHVSESGTMMFIATAGTVASQVIWLGNSIKIMGTSGILAITVGVPVADGTEYGQAGGKVFYAKDTYSDGWRYLEATPSDQSAGIEWSNITDTEVGVSARATAIGTGRANTIAIVGQIVSATHCTSGAAYICDNLTLGGYDDWFLPSKDELYAMYGKKNAIGGFAAKAKWYWSSSEVINGSSIYAWLQNFGDGSQTNRNKVNSYYVRAVRAF